MRKVDTKYWKVFRVGELFDIIGGKGITKNEIFEHQGSLPAIQSGEENFGCIGFIDKDYCLNKKYAISKGECLTVARSGSSGYVGYQSSQCVVGDSAKILEPKFEANTLRLLFIRSALMALKAKYAYTDKVTNENYAKAIILLPVKDGSPDWQFMEDYMRRIEQRAQTAISVFVSSKYAPRKIDTTYWKEYPLYSEYLFEVNMGSKLDRVKMTKFNPIINFVGRGSINNGVVDCVDVIDGIKPYNAGCITLSLGGSVGASFIQEKPFYTSQNVCVLIPRNNLSILCKRFIVTMIQNEGQRKYKAFTDELNRHIRTDFRIKLPTTPTGEPDWRYMEMYMRGVEAITKEKISLLTKKKQESVQGGTINNYGTVNIYEK